jgi:hypothetical protein
MDADILLQFRDRRRCVAAGAAVSDGEFFANILNGFGLHLGKRLASEEFCKEVAAHMSPLGVKFCRHLLTEAEAIKKRGARDE